MAQAQVGARFAVGTYDEQMTPMAQLYNEYFGGGMAGLVFQELREARAFAYSHGLISSLLPGLKRRTSLLVPSVVKQTRL